MAKRKYTRSGETAVRYECTKRACKWQGKEEEKEKAPSKVDKGWYDHVCPNCGNNEFYGLLN